MISMREVYCSMLIIIGVLKPLLVRKIEESEVVIASSISVNLLLRSEIGNLLCILR